ncbi:BppU family phage baseplate upper protein [Listeria booriae]|uniref:BppU family phage baseplate upper protein n=1 Tax=Listeria booriae TaxID=1552123 RepID=UPI0016290D6C|nr:BppU family phage baseplate upper protein [Listeria booriae]MBC1983004.1 BppU family phage baseplate upper protein [Listeria booriae]
MADNEPIVLSVAETNYVGLLNIRRNDISTHTKPFKVINKDGTPYVYTGFTLAFECRTPSGRVYRDTANFSSSDPAKGTFTYTFNQALFTEVGEYTLSYFRFEKWNGSIVTQVKSTQNFSFKIIDDAYCPGTINDDDYISEWYGMLQRYRELLKEFEDIVNGDKQKLLADIAKLQTDITYLLNNGAVKKSGDKMTGKLDVQFDVGLQLLLSTGLAYMRFLTSNNVDYIQHTNPLTFSGINGAKGAGVNFNEEYVKIGGKRAATEDDTKPITIYKKVIMNVADLFNAEKVYTYNLAADEEFVSVKLTFVRYDKANWVQLPYGWNRHIIEADDVDIAGANANHQCGMPDGTYKYAAVSKTQVAGHLYNYDVTFGYALRNVTVYYRKK